MADPAVFTIEIRDPGTPGGLAGPPRPPGGALAPPQPNNTMLGVNPALGAGMGGLAGRAPVAAGFAYAGVPLVLVYDPRVEAAVLSLAGQMRNAGGGGGAPPAAAGGGGGGRQAGGAGPLSTVANIASAFGLPGAGLLSAAAIGGPVGIAAAGVAFFTSAIQKATAAAGNFATAALSFNGTQIARSLFDLAGNIPIVGGIIQGFGNAVLGAGDAVRGLAERLSAYNPSLAITLAMHEVRDIFRDMRRAQRLGPDLVRVVEARKQFEEKMEDLLLRFAPTILQVLEGIFGFMAGLVDNMGAWTENMRSFIGSFLPGNFGNLQNAADAARRTLERIRQQTEEQQPDAGLFLERLLGDVAAARALGSGRQIITGQGAPNFPVFGGV